MYTRRASREDLASLAHYFLGAPTYKLAVGGAGYELTYASSVVVDYLKDITPKDDVNASFAAIARHERALMVPLLEYLLSDAAKARGVRIVGPESVEARVPTISFVVTGDKPLKSPDIVAAFDKKGSCGIRYARSHTARSAAANWQGQLRPFLRIHALEAARSDTRGRRRAHLARAPQHRGRGREDHRDAQGGFGMIHL